MSGHSWIFGVILAGMAETGSGIGIDTPDPLLRAFAGHDAVMLVVDPRSGRIIDANLAAARFYGYDRAELGAMALTELEAPASGPEESAPPSTPVLESVPGAALLSQRRWHRLADGSVRLVEVASSPVDDGAEALLLWILRDVTEAEAAMQALATSETRFRLLAENAYDVIWTMTLDGTITYVSPSVQRMRGITPAEAMRQSLDEIHPPASAARVMDYYARLFAAIEAGTELPTFHGDQEYYRHDGSLMIGELHVVPQVDESGRVVQILGVTRDVTEQRRSEAALQRQARFDTLTGLLNRAEGLDRLDAALSHPRRTGAHVAVAFIDLDYFKTINDTRGHAVGDAVLRVIAGRIRGCVRSDDMVIRVGGDEILVALDGVHDLAQALDIAEQIRLAIAAPIDVGGEPATTTASIGVTLADQGEDVDVVVARADDAMYQAKSGGRHRVIAVLAA